MENMAQIVSMEYNGMPPAWGWMAPLTDRREGPSTMTATSKMPGLPWFVYRLTCVGNGLLYFGMTRNPVERKHHHLYTKSGAPKVLMMRNAFGRDSLEFEVIAWFYSKTEAAKHEKELIKSHDTVWPNGLNLVGKGRGSLGPNMDPAHRERLTQRSRAFWADDENKQKHKEAMASSEIYKIKQHENGKRLAAWSKLPENSARRLMHLIGHSVSAVTRVKIGDANRGKKRTDEQKAALSIIHTGRKASPETIARMSVAQQNRKVSPEGLLRMKTGMLGKSQSVETRRKISEARKAYWARKREKLIASIS